MLKESIASFLGELQTPVTACSRLNGDLGELLNLEWDPGNLSPDQNIPQCQVQPVNDTLCAVQFQNTLEDLRNALKKCKQNMTDGVKAFLAEDCSSMFGAPAGQVKLASVMLLLAKELHTFHLAASDSLHLTVNSLAKLAVQGLTLEDKEKSGIILSWKSVHEVNKLLRIGYGLSDQELSVILAWMHGEDLSESTRKALNQQVDGHIHTYKERLSKSCMPEVDVPVAYNCEPTLFSEVLKDCCSQAEIASAIGQRIPVKKEELESLLHRELPRIPIVINGLSYEIASPGKAFENTKQKMHAVRDLVNEIAQSQKLSATREQLDLFSMRVLATVCTSVANAASRIAVLMAFGKANLVQVKPPPTRPEDRQIHIRVSQGTLGIDVPSTWWLVEDTALFTSLCRDQSRSLPIATVDATYQVSIDAKTYLEKRVEPLPVVHVHRLPLTTHTSNGKQKDQAYQKQFSLRTKLSKATKLFNRRSGVQKLASKEQAGVSITENAGEDVTLSTADNASQVEGTAEDGIDPVPPPRPRRKARKSKRAKSEALRKERAQQRALEEAKKETDWYITSTKAKSPAVQALKGQKVSASVASFEELQEVIDFLSGSSTSSLCLTGTSESDKTVGKDTVLSTSKLAKEDQAKEGASTEPKPSPNPQECENEPSEEKGKASPVDSGLGSTTSFMSSLSCASTVSVVITDHGGHTTGDHTPAVSPEAHQVVSVSSKVPEGTMEEILEATGDTDQSSVACEKSQPDLEALGASSNIGVTDQVLAPDEECDSRSVTSAPGNQCEKSETELDKTGEMPLLELEAWKDPGIVEAFDFILESAEDTPSKGEEVSEDIPCTDIVAREEKGAVDPKEPLNTPLAGLKKAGSNISLKGSTESLYYSAWSINEFACSKSEEQCEKESCDQTNAERDLSVMPPGSRKQSEEVMRDAVDCSKRCQQYDPFSSQYAWHGVVGENLGQLWSDGSSTKVVEPPQSRAPWPPSTPPVGDWGGPLEMKAPEGSRLSQWTGSGIAYPKRLSLGAPTLSTWQSRSNPDVQRSVANPDHNVRFERAPSPLLGSRSEVFTSSNWPGHQLPRRGSFPRAFHRDTGSPGEIHGLSPRDGFPSRDNTLLRSDVSPNAMQRGPPGNFRGGHPGTQPMAVWPNDSRFWIRQDSQHEQSSGQSAVSSRSRGGHTVPLPLGVVRPINDGEPWKAPIGKAPNFHTGQPVREMAMCSNMGLRPGSMIMHDSSTPGCDTRLFQGFPNSNVAANVAFPAEQRLLTNEQVPRESREAQFMMHANRYGHFGRSPRGSPFFADNGKVWDMPK